MLTIPPLAVLAVSPTQNTQTTVSPQTGQQFTLGQVLQASVVEALPDSRFMLEVGGNRVLIQSAAPLFVGQMLDVEVRGNRPTVEFHVLPATITQLFGQALAGVAKNHDLSSIFTLLRNIPTDQLQKLNTPSRQTLEGFTRLLQGTFPQQSVDTRISSPEILNRFLGQATTQFNVLLTSGRQEAAGNSLRTVLQDIAQFFVTQAEVKIPPAADPTGRLSAAGQRLLEAVYTLQGKETLPVAGRSGEQSPAAGLVGGAVDKMLESVGLNPQNPFVQGKAEIAMAALTKGFAELFFLLKGPESINQLLTSTALRSGLLSNIRQQGLAVMPEASPGHENSGPALKELMTRLGLNLENLLARGDKEAAANTVKSALLDLIQKSQESVVMQENGQKALRALEFYQLAQLQLNRDDNLIFPLPFHFLEKGYLLVEDYAGGEKGKDGETPVHRRYSLYLTLKELGNLRVDFLNDDRGLSLTFHCESQQVAEFMSGYQDELQTTIANVPVREVSFVEGGEDPITELVKKCIPRGESFFNVKA
jgi:hypothetical protein